MIKNLINKKSIDLLSKNFIGRLAYISDNKPYVVPITYYYDNDAINIINYSAEGHKVESMRINREVSLQVDEITSVNNWKSVLVQGLFEELEQTDAKFYLHKFCEGVKKIIAERKKENLNFIYEFSSKLKGEESLIVYCIKIKRITGRQRKG